MTLAAETNKLSESEEKKMLAKLALASKCPFHETLPKLLGPRYVKDILPPDLEELVLEDPERFWLPRVQQYVNWQYGAAMFWPSLQWTCFCPKCAAENPTPGKHNRFGYGFSCQDTWQGALRGWNSACDRACKRMILLHLKGSSGEVDDSHQ